MLGSVSVHVQATCISSNLIVKAAICSKSSAFIYQPTYSDISLTDESLCAFCKRRVEESSTTTQNLQLFCVRFSTILGLT